MNQTWKSHIFRYRSLQTSSIPVATGGGKSIGPGVIFESKNKVVDNVQTSSLGSWGDSQINQQVCKNLLLTIQCSLSMLFFAISVAQ